MPILIIIGSEDSLGDITVNRTVHKLLPHSELVMIEGADHVPSLSKPEDFNRILNNFLQKNATTIAHENWARHHPHIEIVATG